MLLVTVEKFDLSKIIGHATNTSFTADTGVGVRKFEVLVCLKRDAAK